MTAMGQTRKPAASTAGSAFASGTDIIGQVSRVRFMPGADISAPSRYLAMGVALFSQAATLTTSRSPDFNSSIAERRANMSNVHARATPPPSRRTLLATLLATAGLGTTIMSSVALAQATPPVTTSANEKEAIHKVLSGYYDAFGRDSAAASAFFGEPTLIIYSNDVVLLRTRADVEAALDKFVASLKPSGYSHSKLGDYRVKLLNSTTALYSSVAIRMKTDGTEMNRAGNTYLLHKSNAGWRIHEIIATDLDKLVSAD
jgi:hypothetical protein